MEELSQSEHSEEELVFLIDLSLQAQQYREVFIFGRQLLKKRTKISEQLVATFDTAIYHLLHTLWTNFRRLESLYQKGDLEPSKKPLFEEVQLKIIKEFAGHQSFMEEIRQKLLFLETLEDNFSVVYLFKLLGDFHRYFCEFTYEELREKNKQQGLRAYKKALFYAEKSLGPCHFLKMGLLLNYALFLNEYESRQKGYKILKRTRREIVNYQELNNFALGEKEEKILALMERVLVMFKREKKTLSPGENN